MHANGQEFGGSYRSDGWLLEVSADPGNALHEYTYHLQYQVPGFHEPGRQFYVDRTTLPDGTREPVTTGKYLGQNIRRRKDRWRERYMGRVYPEEPPQHEGLEVLTRGQQALTYGLYGEDHWLLDLLVEDPEMLDFIIGFWLRFDP